MNPYLFGKVAALSKFAELSPLLKAILQHAAAGAAPGAAMGGITGAIAAPEGKRLQGLGQGALVGGLTGGAIGAGGRALRGRTLSATPGLQPQTADRAFANLGEFGSGIGAAGTGLLAGGVAGAAAAPNEDTMLEKIKAKLGLG